MREGATSASQKEHRCSGDQLTQRRRIPERPIRTCVLDKQNARCRDFGDCTASKSLHQLRRRFTITFSRRSLSNRINFELNRDAVLKEWRFLISSYNPPPRLLMLEPVCLTSPQPSFQSERISRLRAIATWLRVSGMGRTLSKVFSI